MWRARTLTVTVALSALLAVAGCGSKDSKAGGADGAASSATAAAKLRATLTALLTEHAFTLSEVTDERIRQGADSPDAAAAQQAADDTAADLAGAIAGVYGDSARAAFSSHFGGQQLFLQNYVSAKLDKDDALLQSAQSDLAGFPATFTSYVAGLAPTVDKRALQRELTTSGKALTGSADAAVTGAEDFADQAAGAAKPMPDVAQLMTTAIAAKRGGELAGDPDGEGSSLRAAFTAALVQSTELTLLATDARIAKGNTSPRAVAAVTSADDATAPIGEIFSSVYGEDAGESLTKIFQQQLVAFEHYGAAQQTKDIAKSGVALTQLDVLRDHYGALLAGLDAKAGADAAAAQLKPLFDAIAATVRAQASASPKRFDRTRDAAAAASVLAGTLAATITAQHPDRFTR